MESSGALITSLMLHKTLLIYVAAKATLYSFASWQSRHLGGGGFGPTSVKWGLTHSAWMKYVVCFHLYIPWKFGERGSTPRGARRSSLSVCFFCPSLYDARHRKPRWFVYALNLGGTGISPPDSFSFRSSFRFRFRFSSSFSSTTSGDIFYCSGSRQLNHSSILLNYYANL